MAFPLYSSFCFYSIYLLFLGGGGGWGWGVRIAQVEINTNLTKSG